MYRTHESLVATRLVVVLVVFSLLPCGELMATLDAASPAQSSHRWSDADADQARRMVIDRGVGRHIDLRLRSGERLEGVVQEIADDYFVVMPNGGTSSIEIAYDEVRQIGPIVLQPSRRSSPGPGAGAMIAVVVGVLLAVFSYTVQGCSHSKAC